MADLIQKPANSGNPLIDAVRNRAYEMQQEERAGVQPAAVSPVGSPVEGDINASYDLREQAYRDTQMGTQRPPGQVSNEFLLPGRKTVHGIDLVTGERIFNRDTGNPDAEAAFQEGVSRIGRAPFDMENGYTSEEGIGGLVDVSRGTSLSGGNYADFMRNVDQLHLPEGQKQEVWREGQRQHLQAEVTRALAYAEETATDAPEEPEPDIDAEDLPSVQGWKEAAGALYEAEEGAPFAGNSGELVDWYVNEMSSFNWKVGIPGVNNNGMAYYMSRAMTEGEDYAKNLLSLLDTYDRVNTSVGIIGTNIKNLAQDPVSYLGVPGGALAGRAIGGVVAKNAMKKALGQIIASGMGAGAMDVGAETAFSDYAEQSIEQEAGYREELDLAQTAAMGAVGTATGATLGAALPPAVVGAKNLIRRIRRNALKR